MNRRKQQAITYYFNSVTEKPTLPDMLILYCKSGTWIGTFDTDAYCTEDGEEVNDVIAWAYLKNPTIFSTPQERA